MPKDKPSKITKHDDECEAQFYRKMLLRMFGILKQVGKNDQVDIPDYLQVSNMEHKIFKKYKNKCSRSCQIKKTME